jgi:hypothetical protein
MSIPSSLVSERFILIDLDGNPSGKSSTPPTIVTLARDASGGLLVGTEGEGGPAGPSSPLDRLDGDELGRVMGWVLDGTAALRALRAKGLALVAVDDLH